MLRRLTALALIGAISVASAPASTNAQDTIGTLRSGLILGGNSFVPVKANKSGVDPRYWGVVDAIGILQPVGCTATHIGHGIAVSAGHCFDAGEDRQDNIACPASAAIVFWEYRALPEPQVGSSYKPQSRCVRVLSRRNQWPYDYAFFEVDPAPVAAIRVVADAGRGEGVSPSGTLFGHPNRRPLEWSGTCYLPPYATTFTHWCDTEGGSSGTVVLEDNTLLGVGINTSHVVLNHGIYFGATPLEELLDDRFKSAGSVKGLGGMCLDVPHGASEDRTLIELYDCNNSEAQWWTLTSENTLVGVARKCLDSPTVGPPNGTRVWLFQCHGGDNQKWAFLNATIRSVTNKCLDVPKNPPNGTRVWIFDCHGGVEQQWNLTSAHQIRNQQGRCLDVNGGGTENGTQIIVQDCHTGVNQKWDLIRGNRIKGLGGKCLDLPHGNSANRTFLELYDCNDSAAQQWHLQGELHETDTKCLDVSGGIAANGTPIIVQDCHGGSNQQWSYYR
jgi:V8-like Glu-specific endopeptidase